MLGKLLKYEIKAMGRIMLPLYAVLIFAAGFFAVNLRLGMNPSVKSIVDKIALISFVLVIVAIIAVGVVMVILVLQRFYRNLLGEEGYLMFSLPVSTAQHILSKWLSALIWIVLGIAAGLLAGFLMVGIVGNVPEMLKELRSSWNMFFSEQLGEILMVLGTLLLGTMEAVCKVYAAIAVGHQFNSHRVLASVGAYICFGIIEMIISIPLSTDGMMFGRVVDAVADVGSLSSSAELMIGMGVSVIGIIIYGGVAWYLLDRRLNLE